MVLSDLAETATGVAVGRATSIDGWYPAPRVLSTGGSGSTVLSCNLTSGSPTVAIVTGLTTTVPLIGATVTGTAIPSLTTVAASPPPSLTQFTMSANATNNESAESVTVGGMSGYGPVNLTCTSTLSSGSPTVTLVTPPYLGAIPAAGALITGTAIPANTTILASPAPTTSSYTMSANASSNETAETVSISEWTSVSRCVSTFVTDDLGNPLSAADMDALQAWLQGYREAAFLAFVQGPSTTVIYVSAEIAVLPNYDTSNTITQVQSALLAWLNPASWGNPSGAATGSVSWLNSQQGFSVVRFNSVIGVIESVPGVQYAVNGQVFLGTTASPVTTADLTLSGPAPLASSTSESIVITAT